MVADLGMWLVWATIGIRWSYECNWMWCCLQVGMWSCGHICEVVVASGCGGPGDMVTEQTKWMYLHDGQLEGINNEEHGGEGDGSADVSEHWGECD